MSLSLFMAAVIAVVAPVGATPCDTTEGIACVILASPLQQFGRLMREKKSEPGLSDFMSAMNEASRLRYGKRAMLLSVVSSDEIARLTSDRWPTVKRMSAFSSSSDSIPALIDSLNGAERLRFGRK